MDTQKSNSEVLPEGQNLTNSYQAKRETFWNEIGIDEKIERLRNLTKSLVHTLDRQNQEIYDLKTFIWEHSHEENGETVVKVTKKNKYRLNDNLNGLNAAKTTSVNTDKVYI